MMRKFILTAVAASLVLTGCSKKEIVVKPEEKTVVREFVASFKCNDDSTKTSLFRLGKVMWDAGDTIRYYSSENGTVGEFVVPKQTATVKLRARVAENDTWIISAYGGKISETHSGSYFEMDGAVKAEQSGKFADAHVSVAGTRFSSGNTLTFYNMTSLIKFSFTRSDVAYVIFKAKDQYLLHGDGKLKFIVDDSEIFADFLEDTGGSEIKVNVGGTGTYYISTLPGDIMGFTIELYNEDGFSLGYVETNRTLSLKESEIVNIGTLDSRVKTKPIKSVTLDRDTVHLMAGSMYNTYKLNATAEPSGSSVSGFKWTSTADSVAFVSPKGDGTVRAFNKGEADVMLSVYGYGVSGQDTTVTASCHVVVHDFSEASDLSKFSTSNCYMITDLSQKMYKFYCGCKGNDKTQSIHPASVEVLWESFGTDETISEGDLIYIADIKDDSVAFVATGREGNALMAAKDEDGKILWSWHIWITDLPSVQKYRNNNRYVMDRNLGAVSSEFETVGSLGLYYQWGRKDPFLGSSNLVKYTRAKSTLSEWPDPEKTADHLSDNTTLDYSISHPTTFINGSSTGTKDWYCVDVQYSDPYLWRTSANEKGLYDPCPVGYLVPKDSIWTTAFDTSGTFTYALLGCGMNFGKDWSTEGLPRLGDDELIWYPSNSYYDGVGGGRMSYEGHWWSCNVSSNPVDQKRFSSSMEIETVYNRHQVLVPNNYSWRYRGFSVRCVAVHLD